jgi:LysR family transcriptional regulator, glycine cleavage system transcriptional activator
MRRLPPVGGMQAFVTVARLGSLKAAADSLALSSPALTRRIQALEQFVGTPLFRRHHNMVELNEVGRTFFAEIEPHIDALSAAVERISEPTTGMRLRIAVPSLFAGQRLVPALPSLRERHPDLQIDLDTGGNRLNRLGEDVDVAIVIADTIDDRFYSRLIEKGRVVLVASRALQEGANPIREPADLARTTILLHRDMPMAFDSWRKHAGMPELEPGGISQFDSGQLILDAAAEGLGIAFMLESHLSHSTDERLVRLFDDTVESPYAYWFSCLPGALDRRPVRLFHDWLFELPWDER